MSQPQPSNPFKPPVPTMTSASLIPPEPPRKATDPAAELSEDIVARPMTMPDFIDVPLANPNLAARWMFTDRRRFSQAKAQGWRVAKKADIKGNYGSPYEEEGGTKYINGDLILMVIDKRIYLGALKYKHQVAAAYADAAMQRRMSAGMAVNELGGTVAAVNAARAAQGADPVMSVFTPGAADLQGVMAQPGVAAKEAARMGGSRDMGTLADLAKAVDNT